MVLTWPLAFVTGCNIILYCSDVEGVSDKGVIPNHVPLDAALTQAAECQSSLHKWGQANQIVFDPSSTSDNFSLLGTEFDVQLLMHSAVHQCAIEAGWRMRSRLRAQKFLSTNAAIMMLKSHLLSYIESRTAGIAHASTTALAPRDSVQKHFLRQLGITEIEAATVHRLFLFVPGGKWPCWASLTGATSAADLLPLTFSSLLGGFRSAGHV